MMANRHAKTTAGRSGFTLVEILIAIFILSVVMATVYGSYSSIFKTSRETEAELEIYKMSRTALDRMIKDLSSLQPHTGSFILRADKESLNRRIFHTMSFWSASHLDFGESRSVERPALISYYVREDEGDKGFSLWRSDDPGANPEDTKKPDGGFMICRNIQEFRLTFYDANGSETDSWDSSSRSKGSEGNPPRIVGIELFMVNPKDAGNPYKFMTKIFFPVKK